MTGDEMREARVSLDWSQYELADALNLGGTTAKGAQRVREMEAGDRPISGPIARLMEAFADGWRPGS
jgi:transcriptional regulator with XRE-family HTH domain